MLKTAVSHWPKLLAPCPDVAGLSCLVNLPIPAARSVLAQRTLQDRHVHARFAGEVSSSWPLICPTSTLPFDPQKAHKRGPGGGQAFAR
jgi:hypothetical protein